MRNVTPILTGIRNISYRWPNRYSLQYGIDTLDFRAFKSKAYSKLLIEKTITSFLLMKNKKSCILISLPL